MLVNRFDIAEAYWMYYVLWHKGGMTARCHAQGRSISAQLHRMRFSARASLTSEHALMPEGRRAYDALVARWEGDTA